MNAKPILYINPDMHKATSWREDLHPRDKYGKFSTVKGGSRIVTKAGKSGVVEEVTDTHYHMRGEDGRKSKVAKHNAIHEKDHKKVMNHRAQEEKKQKRKKAAASKAKATKEHNKTNATGKTGAAKVIKDPTTASRKKKEDVNQKFARQKKEARESAKEYGLNAPTLEIGGKPVKQEVTNNKTQLQIAQENERRNAELAPHAQAEKENTGMMNEAWSAKDVQTLLRKPMEKRSANKIREIAGRLTNSNDKLARSVVNKHVSRLGYSPTQNQFTGADGRAIRQDTGFYGDLLQSARATMYETLHNVLAGSQTPQKNTDIAMHVASRMHQRIRHDVNNFLNSIPAPKALQGVMKDMKQAEDTLAQTLGRTPTHSEVAAHLEKHSEAFKKAPIVPAPKWDEKKKDWVASNKRIKDPEERLQMLKVYANQQKTASLDVNVGKAEEQEVSLASNMPDNGARPDEVYEKKERQKELKAAIPQALEMMGLTDTERKVFTLMYGHPSEKQNKGYRTMDEVAEVVNAAGGHDGKPITSSWVNKHIRSGMAKIAEARENKHPAIQQLSMLKSFFFDLILKSMYEYDLVKSLHEWGVDHTILEQHQVRTETAQSIYELRKSLSPQEYIGSYTMNDQGEVSAHIVAWSLPESNELYKSFNAFMTDLQKSLFPHKGGSNHAVNQKASEYVKANAGKYKALQGAQHSRLAQKKGQLTWSEQLQRDKGGVWITWGGKKILIEAKSGTILYDSRNEAHREEHNSGAQEHKIDFQHEKDELDEKEEKRETDVRAAWEKHIRTKEAGKKTFDYGKERESFAGKHRGVSFAEDGNIQFQRDTEVTEDNAHELDHGIHAFRTQMEDMRHAWSHKRDDGSVGGVKGEMLDNHAHRSLDAYAELSEDDRKKLDAMGSKEERAKFLGSHFLNKDGVQEALQKYHDTYKSGENAIQAEEELRGFLKGIGSVAGRNTKLMDRLVKQLQTNNPASEGNMEHLAETFGGYEMQRAREEANKNLIPEGKYMLGNPLTGKTMVVHIGGGFEGGRGGKGGKYASKVSEAFDPDGGNHEEINSWGQLGKALGYTGKDAQKLKEVLTQSANTDPDKPFMKKLTDGEYNAHRSNTKAGLQESMTHKNFKLVDEQHDRSGNVASRTFAQDMADGTKNTITVDRTGLIKDPIMARLIQQKKPIQSAQDLHDVLKNAVGNRAWVTAHFGSDIHIGDALGHHVQLEYDGKGAPRVVGGVYDGYRYVDASDLPKNAVDPATGEPIKALFKNGRLVDRKYTTKNKVPMKAGNAVMYPAGDGKLRKGRIHAIEGDAYKVTDGKGYVVGMFRKSQLKEALADGRTLADSGQAVVRVGKTGTHRMNTSDAFKAATPKDQRKADKAKKTLEEALRKAKINQGALDSEGNLRNDVELTDPMMRKLQKVLGRSKTGRELLSKFTSAYTKELEVHVPEHLREAVSAEGVTVRADGTAKISAGKFEQLRNALGGVSIDHEAQNFLSDHFKRKDRAPKTKEALEKGYQSFKMGNSPLAQAYRAQFKPSSYLAQEHLANGSPGGLYSTQLEGLSHLVERGRGIAGHGMGTGKTILGVAAHAHYKAAQIAQGRKPKKTLIVAPAGIQSDWGKEIGSHTNMKALYVGSTKLRKKNAEGEWMQSENGRHMFGQDGTEQEAITPSQLMKNPDKFTSEDHDFHIMSYDQFMKHRDTLAKSGMYDNIVIDEVHAFKNQKGQRGRSLAETTDHFKNVWGLSGTPMENDAREVYSLIDTITGGRHELGSQKEFQDNYMLKDKNGKITGVKPSMSDKLGDILANVVQFRGGEDVRYNDGSKIHFPQLVGGTSEDNPNPKHDFISDMVERNRDHQTTEYYGTKHSTTDYTEGVKEVTNAKSGDTYQVKTYTPRNLDPATQKMYDRYNELQTKYLPESKLNELATAAATGYDQGQKGGENYLTAMQKLQKFLNAPLSERMYVPGGSALDSEATDAQAAKKGKGKGKIEPLKEYDPKTGEGHYSIDQNGHKRYFNSDGKGGYHKNEDGSPKLLPPLHHDNPKAQYLKDRISTYLDGLERENRLRRTSGKPELLPKVVVKSSYTTFGTDIVDGVLRDLQNEHPHLHYWADKLKQEGKALGTGRFTGDADDREDTKTGFRGNKHDYAGNQGNLWATTVSPAGKEGVDFGNAHTMFHFDQDWNPQKMAQFTARVRRSDSVKTHQQVGRDNSVRVESLHMPGTVEDFMFNAQDAKMRDIAQVQGATREAEKAPKYGDTASGIGYGTRGFTQKQRKRKASTETSRGAGMLPKGAAAQAEKSFKYVILV